MRVRRTFAVTAIVLSIAGCSGSSSPDPVSETTAPVPAGLPTEVVQDARDVAADLEQRQAELESMVP